MSERQQWEYMVVHDVNQDGDFDLNEHGAKGWELVLVVRETKKDFSVAYFKRPLLPGGEV